MRVHADGIFNMESCFFFQAEDGIRDLTVTGVQTCALPISFVTVTTAVPLIVSLVAVIVAVPAATPVASPLPLTVAAAVLLLAHVTVRPVSVFPAASLVTAVNC